MAVCEYYSQIYRGFNPAQVKLASDATTNAFRERLNNALAEFYRSVETFLKKAEQYFAPENTGKRLLLSPAISSYNKSSLMTSYVQFD